MDGVDDTRTPPTASQFHEATFAGTASGPSDTLLVYIPDFGDQPFGDPDGVVWSPMGGVLPQAGDRALVVESDDGSWWVVAWWSALQTATAGRLDLLERTRASGPAGARTTTSTTPVALTSGPTITVPSAGTYLVRHEAFIQSQAAGLFQGNVQLAVNGTASGNAAIFVGQAQFDGGDVSKENTLALAAGDVLTLVAFGSNAISTSYSLGTLSITPLP